jgi:lysophospholipase L1-like esterase
VDPKWWIGIGAAVVGWLVLRGRGGPDKTGPVVTRGPLDLIGDSLAVGLSAPLGGELIARLKSPQGEVFRAWGVGGTSAAYWTGQKLDAVLAGEPSAVLVSLGTNDSVTPVGTKAFGLGIQTIVDKVRAAGSLPVLLHAPPMPWDTSAVLSAMQATGAAIVHPPDGLERSSDKIHLTGKGYKDWAHAIAEAII